jgi:hypothetical protein
MKAGPNDWCIVHVGAKEPNIFKHWDYYHYSKEVSAYLDKLRWKGCGYGFAYYYGGEKIWFRKEKHLTMYLLIRE